MHLKKYLTQIKHPWIKISFPALTLFDCVVRNALEIMHINIDWTENWVTKSAFALWAIGSAWVIGGMFYLFFLAFIVQAYNKNEEALLYAGLIMLIIIFSSLSSAAFLLIL